MTLRSKSWQRGGAGSPSRRRHIPAELGGAARAGRRPGASPQLPEGADLEEAPRRRRLSEEVGPLTAEPWCPSHQPPGARSERARTAAVSAARAAGPAVATDQHPRAPPPWAPRPPASWTRASAPTSEVRPPGGPSGRARLGGGRPERVLVVRPGLRASSLYPLRPGSPGATPRGAAGARAAARDASGSARDGRERQVQAAGWGTTSLPPPRPPRGLACPASRPTPGRARRDTSPSGLWRWAWFGAPCEPASENHGDIPRLQRFLWGFPACKENFPRAHAGPVLYNAAWATVSLELQECDLGDDFIRGRKHNVILIPGCAVPFSPRRREKAKEEH